MRIRPYRPEDKNKLILMHRRNSEHLTGDPMQMSYADPEDRDTIVSFVMEDDSGKLVAAMNARAVADVSVVLDPDEGQPRDRMNHFLELVAETVTVLHRQKFKYAVAAAVSDRFGRRLERTIGCRKRGDMFYLDLDEAVWDAMPDEVAVQ